MIAHNVFQALLRECLFVCLLVSKEWTPSQVAAAEIFLGCGLVNEAPDLGCHVEAGQIRPPCFVKHFLRSIRNFFDDKLNQLTSKSCPVSLSRTRSMTSSARLFRACCAPLGSANCASYIADMPMRLAPPAGPRIVFVDVVSKSSVSLSD